MYAFSIYIVLYGKERRIKIKDMSFKGLKVMLHFIILSTIVYCTLLNCLCGNALAIDSNGHFITFAPTTSCSEMTDAIKKFSNTEKALTFYIDGFLSAVNMLASGKADFFEGTSAISRYKFILKYCEDNPLDYFNESINVLVRRYIPLFPKIPEMEKKRKPSE